MKSQFKRFSKSTLSVILVFCMLVSCVTAGIIATGAAVDNSEKAGAVEDSEKVAAVDDSETVGYDAVDIHTNASVDGGWVTTNLSTSDGNHYTGNIYFKGKTSGNYEMGMHVAGEWKVFGGYWINDNTAYNTAWGSGGSANDQIPPISTDTTKYIKGVVDFYKEYSGKPRLLIDQQLLTALSTTATVGTTSLQSGSTTTVGCTNSGGSGSYSNSYTVRQGSASGTDVTSSVLSGTTFTAPSVSSSTTYYVTTTVTDSNTGATATSAAKTITVTSATYNVSVSAGANGSAIISKNSPVSGSATSVSFNNGTTNNVYVKATPNQYYKVDSWSPTPSSTSTDSNGAVTATFSVSSATSISVSFAEDPVYSVVGDNTLTGTTNSWDISSTSTEMTKSGNNYAITFNNIAAGTYQFKVAKNHAWDNAVGYSNNVSGTGLVTNVEGADDSNNGLNIQFTLSESANVTITYTSPSTVVINAVSNLTKLATPINVKINNKTSETVAAAADATVPLTWTAVSNAGSYKIYKDSDTEPFATVSGGSTTTYNIPKKHSNSGVYYVVAVPSNTSLYSESNKSSGVTLTVTKNNAPATPSISIDKTAIGAGESTTITVSNAATFASNYTLKLYKDNVEQSDVISNGTFTVSASGTYKVKAIANDSDYYADSSFSSTVTLTVYTSSWYLVGSLVDSTDNKWNNQTTYPVDTFVSANVFKRTVTYENGGTNDKHYFRLYNGSNQYTVTNGTDTDMSTHNSSGTAVTASTATTNGSMYVTGQGEFNIYVDQSGSSPKVWVVKNALQTYTTTVYVNQDSGATNLYAWKDGNNEVSAWPGEDITGTTETVNDIPYYKYTFEGYWDHINMVPNKNNGNVKTADITNVAANATYYITWDGSNETTASVSTTAPTIQLGYKVQNTSSVSHVNFASRSVSVTLGANITYEFWMKSANTHYNDQGSGTMTRANCTNWTFNTNTTNTKITTDLAGTYTFTYTVSGSNFVMSVTYPTEQKYNVTISQGDHGTLKVNDSAISGSSIVVQIGELTKAMVEAVAAEGYHFREWTYSGGVTGINGSTKTNNPISNIGANDTGTMTANYDENTYTVTLQSGGNGTITAPSPAQLTAHPYTATSLSGVTVSPATGYKFNGWTTGTGVTLANGSATSASAGSITASQNSTMTANFTKVDYTITYPSSPTGYTLGSSNPTGAQYGDSVSFTVTASSGYRITGVTYTPTSGSAQNCTAGSNNTYSFTMPAANVTISVSTVQTYTVKLTAGEGFASIQYKKNSSGTYASYTSGTTLTVDKNTDVYFSVTYSTGYQYSSKTNLTVVTANTVFRTGAVSANVTATLTASKIPYNLTGSVSPAHGTVTFYSNSGCTTQITTATYQQTVYAKYTPADGYVLKNFTYSGTGITNTSTSGNVFTFTMGYAAATITANVMLQYSVDYYVDMHDNSMSGKTVEVAIVTNGGGTTVAKDSSGNDCKATLTKQGNSTVYMASINTPVTQTSGSYSGIYVRVTYTGKTPVTKYVEGTNVATLATTHEMWLEAENEASTALTVNYATRSTPSVADGYRRIYVAKPYSWETSETNWATLGIYHWGEYTDIGWSKGIRMNYLGNSGSDGYHYYYADIPKALASNGTTVVTDGTGNKVSNIIFQGWNSTNPAAGTSPNAQTGNIENIPDSANFYILSKEDGAFVGTKSEEDAVIANYTRYVSSVEMNKTESTEVNISPTYTGGLVTYTPKVVGTPGQSNYINHGDYVTVDRNGVIHPVKSTIGLPDDCAEIIVKVYSTIGRTIYEGSGTDAGDCLTYTVRVNIHDPSQFNGFEIMSLESQTYTVSVPQIGSDQPGYFDMTSKGSVITVTGLLGVDSSTKSAIINPTTDNPTSFTVKYAKANNTFSGYSDIEIIGTIVTKSNHNTTTGKRYGLKQWKLSDDSDPNYTISRKVANGTGIETATTTGVTFSSASATYSAIFEEYQYVDVTFTFNYDEYVPKVVDGMIQYPYDADWANNEDSSDASSDDSLYNRSHNTKTFVIKDYEVRYRPEKEETFEGNLKNAAAIALGIEPSNNYYDYKLPDTVSATTQSDYKATSTVKLIQSVKQYKVFVNGVQIKDSDNNPLTYTYQEYAEPSVQIASDWYAVDSSAQNASTDNAPLLATNVNSYKFRVKGSANSTNTYLRTVTATNPHGNDFLRSEVDFSHYEVTHQGSSPTSMKEYLMQNFYIADFFSPAEVLDPKSYTGKGKIGEAYKVEKSESSASPSSGNITVYFTDTLNWNNIKIYYWGENIDVQWPGNAMMQYGTDEDGKTVYSASISENVEGIIFTGNEKQTVDITKDIANGSHWKSINETAQNGIPYDDAQFVGGGVVYYSMNGVTENSQGTPFANAVSSGYVDGSTGEANPDEIKEMLKANIEAYYSEDVSGALGEEEAMKIAYGTEIAATKNVEGGFNTGIIYRYLPLTQYKRVGKGEQTVDIDLSVGSNIVKWKPKSKTGNKWEVSHTTDGSFHATGGQRTVRFQNTENWDVVCVHYWGGSKASYWPGIKMSLVEGQTDVYEAVIPADSTNVVFSDGGYMPETDGNGDYTLDNKTNNNTFRYSNSLQSYQYVYASGNENKATNAGKNMRLYSYYVYSYVTYDQETNVPVTKYEIVLSDNYSDASTYWEGNPNPDPSN